MNCPICGKSGYCGATIFECNTPNCQNYKDSNTSPYNRNYNSFGGVSIKQITIHGTLQGLAPLPPVQYHISPQTKVVTIKYRDPIKHIGVIIEPSDFAKQFTKQLPLWKELVKAAETDGITHVIVEFQDQDWIKDGQYTIAQLRKKIEDAMGPF